MDEAQLFKHWLEEAEDDPDYIVHGLLYEITESICEAMERQNVTRAELADRLGVKRQQITNFLNTPGNTTLKTIVRFANALDLDVSVELQHPVTMTAEVKPDLRQWQTPVSSATTAAMPLSLQGSETTDGYREAAT